MPRGDRTGPNGMGSMTGRAAGFCSGNSAPGFMNSFFGRGAAGGGQGGFRRQRFMGFARGFRNFNWQPWNNAYQATDPVPYNQSVDSNISKEQQIEALKAQAANLSNTLAGINKQIDDLQTSSPE